MSECAKRSNDANDGLQHKSFRCTIKSRAILVAAMLRHHSEQMSFAPLQTINNQDHPFQTGFRDERFTASYLGISVETLRTWRKQNRGPRYRRIGRCVRYSIPDLVAFVEAAPSGGGQTS